MSNDVKETITQINTIEDANNFFLEEIEEDGKKQKRAKVSLELLSQMGVVGSALSSVVAQIAPTASGTYTIANGMPGFALKAAKDGSYWGAMKNAEGISKMVKLKEAAPAASAGSCVAAIAVVVAVAIVEHQIGRIIRTQEQIISFLENERESDIEGDVRTLKEIIEKYSCSFDNERFMSSNHIIISDIKRKALSHLASFKKDFDQFINAKNSLVTTTKSVQNQLDKLLRKFKYYRLSAYTYSLSSFLDVLFSCSFSEEYINKTKASIDGVINEYNSLYEQCLNKLNEVSNKTLELNAMKGYGKVTKWIGEKALKNTKEAGHNLSTHGEKAIDIAEEAREQYALEFEKIKTSNINAFVNKLEEIDMVYNRATKIACDKEYLYLYA